jgi:hypothetical protein
LEDGKFSVERGIRGLINFYSLVDNFLKIDLKVLFFSDFFHAIP